MLFLTKKRKQKIVNNLSTQFNVIFKSKGIILKEKDKLTINRLLSESFNIKKGR